MKPEVKTWMVTTYNNHEQVDKQINAWLKEINHNIWRVGFQMEQIGDSTCLIMGIKRPKVK